ncbi:MAG TPA: DMT family transporter [Candidatus Limnocylindrales bacterium]|nr:DMT family transporter [Candidatus Limnocylindrales bacterium]
MGERWAIASALAYTIVNITLRVAAPHIDPFLGSFVRLLPLAALSWLVVLRSGAREVRPSHAAFLSWRLIGYLLAGGAASLIIGNVFYFQALTNGGLGITIGGVQAGSILGGLWLGLLLNRDRPTTAQLAAAVLIVAGLAGIAIAQTQQFGDLWWLGLAFAIGAGTTYALANVFSRTVQRERPLLFVSQAVSMVGGGVPLALILVGRVAAGESIPIDGGSVAAVLLAGCFNAVALLTLTLAVRAATVATVNTIGSSTVVLSFIASVTLFGETSSAPMVAGIALVTVGIVVAQLRRRASRGSATALPEAATAEPAATEPSAAPEPAVTATEPASPPAAR